MRAAYDVIRNERLLQGKKALDLVTEFGAFGTLLSTLTPEPTQAFN
jgi:hypothetical protein